MSKRNRFCFIFIVISILAFSAGCGSSPQTVTDADTPTQNTVESADSAQQNDSNPTSESAAPLNSSLPDLGKSASSASTQTTGETEKINTDEQEENGTADERKALAETYIDKPLSELIEEIGEPTSSEYAPSCLGDGEDGELEYDGFTVYTYREGESEIVRGVY